MGCCPGYIRSSGGLRRQPVRDGQPSISIPISRPGISIWVGLRSSWKIPTMQYARWRALTLDSPELLLMRYYIAFLKSDYRGMQDIAALGTEKTGAQDWISHAQSSVLAYSGRLRKAGEMSRFAIELARQAHQTERAAMYEA